MCAHLFPLFGTRERERKKERERGSTLSARDRREATLFSIRHACLLFFFSFRSAQASGRPTFIRSDCTHTHTRTHAHAHTHARTHTCNLHQHAVGAEFLTQPCLFTFLIRHRLVVYEHSKLIYCTDANNAQERINCFATVSNFRAENSLPHCDSRRALFSDALCQPTKTHQNGNAETATK